MKSLYGSYKTPVFQHWLSAWPTCRNHPIMRCPLRCWVVNKADNPKIPGCYREQCLPRDEEDKKDSSESEDVGDKRLFSPFQKESKEQPPWAAFCALRGSTTSTRDMKGLWTFYHAGLDTQLRSSRMLSAQKYNWETPRDLSAPWRGGFLPRAHAEVASTDLGKWAACYKCCASEFCFPWGDSMGVRAPHIAWQGVGPVRSIMSWSARKGSQMSWSGGKV